ncbi:hypothetical protein [Zymobacter palmae]|uniref:hypothetical protein n=1 Tax=Zymobacter palmae TaxID=33074 RepID=UPI0004873A8E|nr:hypothetical protein [Zymobacter palmae]
MSDQEHIETVKKSFLKRGGYSSEKNILSLRNNSFLIDLNGVNGIVDLFNCLSISFPLETELSQENVLEKNWDSLDDSIGGAMISKSEEGSICYVLIGFEEFSNKYPDAWELLSILYKNADYIKNTSVIKNDINIYVFR